MRSLKTLCSFEALIVAGSVLAVALLIWAYVPSTQQARCRFCGGVANLTAEGKWECRKPLCEGNSQRDLIKSNLDKADQAK